MNNVDDIRRQLVSLREQSGKSAKAVQNETGTQLLYAFESGKKVPRLDTFVKWCNSVGIKLTLTKTE